MGSHNRLPLEFQETINLLEELFEIGLDVYYNKGSWQSEHQEDSIEPSRLELLDRCFDLHQPVTSFDAEKTKLAVISIPLENKLSIVVAEFKGDSQQVEVEKFSKVAERLLSQTNQQTQTSAFCEELSNLMEETTWLRNISQYVRMCDVRQKSKNIIQSMLPRLQEMIKARSIGFISREETGLNDTWLGEPCQFNLKQLIEVHEASALQQPVVINNHSFGKELGFPRSYILVHVGTKQDHYGWILAVERIDQHSLAEECEFSTTGILEFGTPEAGLIQAAADLLSTHAQNNDLYVAREQLLFGVIQAMSDAVDARDPYTKGHSDRVASYAKAIAEEMGYDELYCERIHLTGLLHDIGKIGIPDRVLNKQGKLTDEEYSIIKKHPQIGYNILSHLNDLSFVLPGVLHHHERADGKGYPHGLTDEQNSSDANILAVADAFDAMTSTRSYRPGMSLEKAKRIIKEETGTQFASEAAAAFLRAWPEIVRISTSDTTRCQEHREASDLLTMPMGEIAHLELTSPLAVDDA